MPRGAINGQNLERGKTKREKAISRSQEHFRSLRNPDGRTSAKVEPLRIRPNRGPLTRSSGNQSPSLRAMISADKSNLSLSPGDISYRLGDIVGSRFDLSQHRSSAAFRPSDSIFARPAGRARWSRLSWVLTGFARTHPRRVCRHGMDNDVVWIEESLFDVSISKVILIFLSPTSLQQVGIAPSPPAWLSSKRSREWICDTLNSDGVNPTVVGDAASANNDGVVISEMDAG
ncbi:hypothetical protein KSP40_PGU017139 [Platanthera guangdongensis]|uniref:Uncharacterized protein n=1 Tax=Platanthera guangdongensis TaxID=2320717 RepID=A0ABR2M5L0_9ASPA